MGKPRIAADVAVITHEEDLSPNVWGVLGRLTLLLAGFAAVMAAVSWFALSLTMLPSVQAGDNVWLVKRGGWEGSYAPAGAQVMVMDSTVDRSMLSRAVLPLMPPGGNVVGYVVAAPTNSVTLSPAGTIVVDGVDSGAPAPGGGMPPAGSSYLVTCVAGACTPGGSVAAPAENVLGEVVKQTRLPVLGFAGGVAAFAGVRG